MIRFGIIGYGYWGPNLARNLAEADGAQIVAVSDLSAMRLANAQRRYPNVFATNVAFDLIHHSDVDAVVIATPLSTHFELALNALRAGKHVLVEKPITPTIEQGQQLIDEAARRQLTLMVDHTFVYTPAVHKMHELVTTGALGDIYYYDSVRVNLGLFQRDTNVIWDLAVHDLAIMNYVLPMQPCAVSATGMSHINGQFENIAYLTLFFDAPIIAHLHVNWLAPVKVRRTLLGGSKKMIVYDDLQPSEKIKVYDKGVTVDGDPESVYKMLVGYRAGDMWAPQLAMTEALKTEMSHFVECINTRQRPLTDGEVGLQVVRILDAASKSMAQRGQLVELAN